MNLQLVTKSINQQEINTWNELYQDEKIKYDDFVTNMMQQGYKKEDADKMWLSNFGATPPSEPDRFYYCNILEPSMRLTVTVIKRNNIQDGKKKFEVVKLNHLFLDGYDYVRKFVINNGKLEYIRAYEDLTADKIIQEDYNYSLNYNDGNWFKSLAIDGLLSKLKLKILPKNNDDKTPSVYVTDFNQMESTDIEITDKEFESKLFELIERRFELIESELK